MSILITSDLHLTDNPDDEYRWGLFPWLHSKIKEHGVTDLLVLGDVTDKKDRHTAPLVNQVADQFIILAMDTNVTILKGNHDYIDPDKPFFGFLNGIYDSLRYIIYPEALELVSGHPILCLPHTRNPGEDWRTFDFNDPRGPDFIFLHHTITGSRASNGMRMEGIDGDIFKNCRARIYSGDIHVPQRIKGVTYVGSPYHVHFGDDFTPRVLLLEQENGKFKERNLYFPSIRKRTITISSPDKLDEYDLNKDDHVKICLKIPKAQFCDWEKYQRQVKDICAETGAKLHSITLQEKPHRKLPGAPSKEELAKKDRLTNDQAYNLFCRKEKLDDTLVELGKEFLKK